MKIDYKAIPKISLKEQTDIMKEFFLDISGRNRDEQIDIIQEMIGELARNSTDSEYISICKASIQALLSMKESDMKRLLSARLAAQFKLEDYFERTLDSTDFMKAIQAMPEKEKLIALIREFGYF
jgi:hypothetical protein